MFEPAFRADVAEIDLLLERGGMRAELVNAEPGETVIGEQQRQLQRIQALWLAWNRNRGDLDALRGLHAASVSGWARR